MAQTHELDSASRHEQRQHWRRGVQPRSAHEAETQRSTPQRASTQAQFAKTRAHETRAQSTQSSTLASRKSPRLFITAAARAPIHRKTRKGWRSPSAPQKKRKAWPSGSSEESVAKRLFRRPGAPGVLCDPGHMGAHPPHGLLGEGCWLDGTGERAGDNLISPGQGWAPGT